MAAPSFSNTRKLAQAKAREYSIVSQFSLGYRNREDVTNLPPGVLIVGSQNVLTNVSERVQIRQGYALDGLVNYVDAPVLSSFDWLTRGNGEIHMRAGRLTSAGDDGLMQYRYVAQGSELGDNLVQNGKFTGNATGWNSFTGSTDNGALPSGNWAYNSNNIIHSTGATDGVGQQVGLSPITPYHVKFDIGGAAGSVDVYLNDSNVGTFAFGTTVNADFTSGGFTGGYDGLFIIVPSSDFDGTIDNVSVNQILPAGYAYWKNLLTDLTSVSYNFAKFWNATESLREVLFVNGGSYIYAWNGASTVVASSTSSTITKTGTDTWNDAGFYSQSFTTVGASDTQFDITNTSGTTYRYTWDTTGTDPVISSATFPIGSYVLINAEHFNAANNGLFVVTNVNTNYFEVTNPSGVAESNKTIGSGYIYKQYTKVLLINGNAYAYTGGEGTTTLTGVTPSPTGEPTSSIAQQAVITTANTAMTDLPATFPNSLIETLNNQVYVGSILSSALYISNINSYTDYSSSTPRQTGEGAVLILDDNCVGLKPQENFMYVTCGQDLWYNISFQIQTSTVGVTYEQVQALPLKTGRRQAAISQAYLSHMKNNIIVVTQETTIDTFGRVESSLATPQTTNISDPIKLDIDSYDFTDGSIAYWRYYILVAIPKEGIVRIFNLATKSWEAPQTLPISRFYIVDGELYGHSYNTFESYKLFTGYADRVDVGFAGYPISAIWRFSYQNYGSRFSLKKATKMYVEGYINANTMLTAQLIYELDGCQTVKTFTLDGNDRQFVCVSGGIGALGDSSLGKVKLGGDQPNSINNLPPKFRWFPTFTNTDFFENSVQFSVLGTDNRMELLGFGLSVSGSSEIPVQKMD